MKPKAFEYRLLECAECGFGWLDPTPDAEALSAFYAPDYTAYRPELGEAARSFSRKVKMLVASVAGVSEDAQRKPAVRTAAGMIVKAIELAGARAVPLTTAVPMSLPRDAAILDYGCGVGWWLQVLRSEGFTNLFGYDIDNPGLDPLEQAGITVLRSTASFPSRTFDAIRLEHVLEHLTDPIEKLATIRESLAPRGRLVIAVPDYSGWSSKRAGIEWAALTLPHHVNQFTPGSLERIARRAGLRLTRLQRLPIWEAARPVLFDDRISPATARLLPFVPTHLAKVAYFSWSQARGDGDYMAVELVRDGDS